MDSAILVQNIKDRCRAKGIYPTVACAESGAGKSLISQIEKRGIIPSVEKIQQLATYLGCTVSDLLGEAPPGDRKTPTTETDKSGKPDFLIKFESLSPEDQEEVIAIIEMKAMRRRKDKYGAV